MIVNVHMADGRTVFQFASRGDLRRAMEPHDEPAHDGRAVQAFVFGPTTSGWQPVRVTHIRKYSIAFVISAEDVAMDDADLPAKKGRDERADKFREREQEAAAA